MKIIIAKKWRAVSLLGEAIFTGVPLLVPEDFPAEKGQIVSVERKNLLAAIGVSGEVTQKMDREIAKQWVIDFIDNKREGASITPDEIYGILLVLGISKTDFAHLLRVHKGSVTKYIDGSLKPTAPVAQLMVIYLAAELTKKGRIKTLLQKESGLIYGLNLTVPDPTFTIDKIAS